jgi:fused signal recognition particle receptor
MFFKENIIERLRRALTPTRNIILNRFFEKKEIDFLEELEERLILSDVGVETTKKIIDSLKKKNFREKEEILNYLKEIIDSLLGEEILIEERFPMIILIIGVNGVGKTTTIAKIAYKYKNNGKKVLLVAGDTFRAAAREQLEVWAERLNIDIVRDYTKKSPSAVVYDALSKAKAREIDVLIVDTAGRMYHKIDLMKELKKIKNISGREFSEADLKIFLVLDATMGQNTLRQVELFNKEIGLDGIIMAKLDGTAKGGMILAIKDKFSIPIVYLGIGEKIEDLIEFRKKDYIESLIICEDDYTD